MPRKTEIAIALVVVVLLIVVIVLLLRVPRAPVVAPVRVWDPFVSGTGNDGAEKIASIIGDPEKCPAKTGAFPLGTSLGCVIDARTPITTSDLLWKSNPFHGPNRSVVLLLGTHTYVACVPLVTGQSGYMITGVDGPASVPGGSRIRPGSTADGCPETFPGGKSAIVMKWPHGLYPAGTYFSLLNDCGDTQNDSPTNTVADCFGGQISHVQFDASANDTNPTTVQPAANFLYFSGGVEERGGLFDVSLKNCVTACAFFDRQFQIGPPSPGGSGPVHFTLRDVVMTERTDGYGDLKTDGLVAELNTTRITFQGQANCIETTDPRASGEPTAYTIVNGGNPDGPATVTNGGNCSIPPAACEFHATGGTGATCDLTTSGTKVASVTIRCVDECAKSSNYSRSAVPGGGPLIERLTIAGSDEHHRFRNAIAIKGDRDTLVMHLHTERIGNPGINPGSNGDTILHGFGTAPWSGGAFLSVNTTSLQGGCVHEGVGALSPDYFMGNITREISPGCVIVDDNVIDPLTRRAFSLNTTDVPSHRRVGIYAGGSENSFVGKPNAIFPCAGVGTSASPSVVSCGSATSGTFSCASSASGSTCTVKTSAVSATNQILVTQVAEAGTRLKATCDRTPSDLYGAFVSARVAGESFSVTLPTFSGGALCFDFQIAN